jgi:hypothetical protein
MMSMKVRKGTRMALSEEDIAHSHCGCGCKKNEEPSERDIELQDYLNEIVETYAAILRLQDWTIEASYGTLKEVPANCEAFLSYDRYHGEAEIIVLHPDQVDLLENHGPSFHEADIEESAVHELVHLRFIDVQPEDQPHVTSVHEERAINAMTKALVQLMRTLRSQDDEIRALKEQLTEAKKESKQKGKKS